MINEVTKYKTNDGKEFLNEEGAKDHILDNLKKAFGNHIKQFVDSDDLKYETFTKIVNSMFCDIEKAEYWCSILVNNLKEDY